MIQLAHTLDVPVYFIALKVASKIIDPYGTFVKKYQQVWGDQKDISGLIEQLKIKIRHELTLSLNSFMLNIPSSGKNINIYSIKNGILSDKSLMCSSLKDYSNSEATKRNSEVVRRETDESLELNILNFIYFTEIIPLLEIYRFSGSFSSDSIYDEGSNEDVLSLKPSIVSKYDSSYQLSAEESKYSTPEQQEMETMLPLNLLVNSYKVCERISHSLQYMFATDKYSRISILDQLAYVIKDIKLQNLDSPKRILLLYHHLDLFLKVWKDLVKDSQDEKDFLQNHNHYEGNEGFTHNLQFVLRLIETLCACNLVLDSSNLKKLSSSILKSTYYLLTTIDIKNEINPYH